MKKINTLQLVKAFSAFENLLNKTYQQLEKTTYDNSETKFYHNIEKRLVAEKVTPSGIFDEAPIFRLIGRVSAKQRYNNCDYNCGEVYSMFISKERDTLGFPVWAIYEKFNIEGVGPEISQSKEPKNLVARKYFLSNAIVSAHKRGVDASGILRQDIKVESEMTDMPLLMTKLKDNSKGKKKLSSLIIDAYESMKNQYKKIKEQHEQRIFDSYFEEMRDQKKFVDDRISIGIEMRGNDVACGSYPSYHIKYNQGGSMDMARIQVEPISHESYFPADDGFKVERYLFTSTNVPKSLQYLKIIATTKDAKEADLIAHEQALTLAYRIAKDIGLSITKVEDRSESDMAKLLSDLKRLQHEEDKEAHLRDHLGISLLDKFHKDFRKYN